MNIDPKGKNLFIVDNSVSGWTGLRYLKEWTDIAKTFDIATGYFEIGALLALDGNWQKLDEIRILMGADTTYRTRKLLLEAVQDKVTRELEKSIEDNKDVNPFLLGVPGILEALQSKKIKCRVYDMKKFHAKAYITHSKLEVVGSQALVGSSNFTHPGLVDNIELNVQVQSAREVAQLQEWFEEHWEKGVDVSDAVIGVIERHAHAYTPYDVYTKALQEFFRGHELTATEWDEKFSKIYPRLDRYQKEAYWSLMKIARQHGGAFLCDGVGLGKTFVGLMLIERLILHEGKRVVLFAPKGAKEGVWEPHLRQYLSHIGGVGGGADFSNLAVFSHTDLTREGDFPERFKRITELADAVIIDEAHHFRNPGRLGAEEEGITPSRYYRMFNVLDGTFRPKQLFLLTATPINNQLSDFRHMVELFTRRDESYFAQTLGVNNLRAHFTKMEKDLRKSVGSEEVAVDANIDKAQTILTRDTIFRELVVQRSRAYARESQNREGGSAAMFPDRKPPIVADYSIRKTYGPLLDMFEKAFMRKSPLFTLAIYYPLAWYIGKDKEVNPFVENQQKQVVGLIRTQFLKRFESSICAFELSCVRLMEKLLAFLIVQSSSPAEKKRLDNWMKLHMSLIGYAAEYKHEIWSDDEEGDLDEDVIPQELVDDVEKLDYKDFDVGKMMDETYRDLDLIVSFLEEMQKFKPTQDDKLQKLIRLLGTKELKGRKVLIFTEFADTARYLFHHLTAAGIPGVAQVDSSTKGNRAEIIQRFSPYYNEISSAKLVEKGQSEISVLISTDVLSEGLNLQDASLMMNYDIHWNPVRLMQRIGRVDRRMNPMIEQRLVADHPEVRASRGNVSFWNFLPPDELNDILTLYKKVTQKTLLISKTLGIEGKKLLTPEDNFEALREFNQAYEGVKTEIEDMHLEYQALMKADPGLQDRLTRFPRAVFSGRERTAKGTVGVFFCYALPALDKELGEFSYEAGTSRWYLYDLKNKKILEEPQEIIESIRSDSDEQRICITEQAKLIDLRKQVERHITNTYLRRVNATLGVKPSLKCWMELNEV